MWPPLAITTLPVLDVAKVSAILLLSVSLTLCGKNKSLFSSYTFTIKFWVLNPWLTVCASAFVKVSTTVADWLTVILVKPDPSPLNEPVIDDADTKLETCNEPVITAEPLKGKPTPAPPPAFKA